LNHHDTDTPIATTARVAPTGRHDHEDVVVDCRFFVRRLRFVVFGDRLDLLFNLRDDDDNDADDTSIEDGSGDNDMSVSCIVPILAITYPKVRLILSQ
jgi:hypothetical protein